MKLDNIMENELLNQSGWITSATAVFLNTFNWLTDVNFNQFITAAISIFSIIFLVMKIYHQYLTTKELKNKLRNEDTK